MATDHDNHDRHGLDVRWNPDGCALADDGHSQIFGRWEAWADDDLVLWWSDSDREAFRQEQQGGWT